MKLSQFKKLIREEIQKVLREGQETTLSQLQVGDKFSILEDALVVPANTGYSSTYNLSYSKYKDLIFEVVKLNPKTMVCIPYNKDGKYPDNVAEKLNDPYGTWHVAGKTRQDLQPPILPSSVVLNTANLNMSDSAVADIITKQNAWENGERPKYDFKDNFEGPTYNKILLVQFAPHKKDARVMTK